MFNDRILEELTQEYNDMNIKNLSRIHVRSDLSTSVSETTRCLAISTFGLWKMEHIGWNRMLDWLTPLLKYGILYRPTPKVMTTDGRLHWTLQQCQPFVSNSDISYGSLDPLHTVLKMLEGITLIFRGIVVTPTGIALRGFPYTEQDYKKILTVRRELTSVLPACGIAFEPPYVNTICHATVFRWTSEPTAEIIAYVSAGLQIWSEAHIATLRPYRWEFGWMTLRCREYENHCLAHFHIPLRIAHRGLLDGPSVEFENSIEKLTYNCSNGIHSECDVWLVDDIYWLGHDTPTNRIPLEWLCDNSEYLLIHAKTPETFHALYKINNLEAANLHLFYHTDEDIVITTYGDVIVYPGKTVLPGWMSMMPERAPEQSNISAAAICSDYVK